ncbi:MAG: TIGR03086 family metal-binding protein [Acidimicrobiia bacterium]
MSQIADRHRRLAAGFTARVEAVPPDRWESPSPCPGWTARNLVEHVAGNCGTFLGMVGKELPPGPDPADDPLGAWTSARDALQAALDDPAVATLEYEGAFGRSTLERAVDGFQSLDLIVHGWDLARATGGDERIDPGDVHHLFERVKPLDEVMRQPGAIGAKLEAPEGADEQTQLLAFLGRRSW